MDYLSVTWEKFPFNWLISLNNIKSEILSKPLSLTTLFNLLFLSNNEFLLILVSKSYRKILLDALIVSNTCTFSVNIVNWFFFKPEVIKPVFHFSKGPEKKCLGLNCFKEEIYNEEQQAECGRMPFCFSPWRWGNNPSAFQWWSRKSTGLGVTEAVVTAVTRVGRPGKNILIV